VVFPAPFGPRNPNTCPHGTERSSASTAVNGRRHSPLRYDLPRPCVSIAADTMIYLLPVVHAPVRTASGWEVSTLVWVFLRGFLIDIAAEARGVIDPEIAVPVDRAAGDDLLDLIAEEDHLLHPEVGSGQVQVDVRGVSHR